MHSEVWPLCEPGRPGTSKALATVPSPPSEKNRAKFKEWLDIGSIVDTKPNQDVIEVIGYLAYETVHEVNREGVGQEVSLPNLLTQSTLDSFINPLPTNDAYATSASLYTISS